MNHVYLIHIHYMKINGNPIMWDLLIFIYFGIIVCLLQNSDNHKI